MSVSEVQRRQMTTVMAPNIHNIAVQGNFDDCQAMVKTSFVAEPFLPDGRRLVAVNSINWARIMAQIVYYFYSALALGRIDRPTSFSVPTGNFGDILRVIWQSRWVCLSKTGYSDQPQRRTSPRADRGRLREAVAGGFFITQYGYHGFLEL